MRKTVIIELVLKFLHETRGNVAIIFGLALVPILGLVGVGIDYGRGLSARTQLQAAADTAALAALSMGLESESEQIDAAHKAFSANFDSNAFGISVTPSVTIDDDTATVSANATMATQVLGVMKIEAMDIAATSTAIRGEAAPICILGLDPTAPETVHFEGSAILNAVDCAVHSNSNASEGLKSNGSSTRTAAAFCTVGGYNGNDYTPQPIQCPEVEDPLAGLVQPLMAGCDYTNKIVKKEDSANLIPGTYCGGLSVEAHSVVTLEPGIYVMKDGPLNIEAHSSITAEGVMFYLYGSNSYLLIESQASMNLTAPISGPYEGIIIAQDPNSSVGMLSNLQGGGVLNFVGSIYLPTQTLDFGGNGEIGTDTSNYAIIAYHIGLRGGATLHVGLDEGLPGGPVFAKMGGDTRLLY